MSAGTPDNIELFVELMIRKLPTEIIIFIVDIFLNKGFRHKKTKITKINVHINPKLKI